MSSKKQKKYKLNGVVLDLNIPLSNGLIISKEAAERAVEEFNQRARSGKFGELNRDVHVIGTDLCKVSHVIDHLHIEHDKIIGKGMLVGGFEHSQAAKVRDLVESGNAYFAPRMLGDTEHLQDLLAIDIVPGPYVEGKEPIKHVK